MEISDGSKIKFIRVKPDNEFGADAIAWVGNWPEEFNSMFEIDLEEQYQKTFLSVLERMWVVLGWCGKEGIQMKRSKLASMFL